MALDALLNCPHMDTCGACQLGDKSYADQLVEKSEYLNMLFSRYVDAPINVTPSPQQRGYRSRAMFRTHASGDRLTLGFFKIGTRSLNTVEQCIVADAAINYFLESAQSLKLHFGEGTYRYRWYVMSIDSKRVDVLIHSVEKNEAADATLIAALQSLDAVRNVFFDHSPYEFKGIEHHFENGFVGYESLGSFAQVNRGVNQQIQNYILELVNTYHVKKLLDVYGGSANLSLPSLHMLSHLTVVEISPASLVLAARSCKDSEIVTLRQGSVESEIEALMQQSFDMMLVDPPRKGLESVTHNLRNIRCEYLVYVSCNAESLKQDLGTLDETYYVVNIKGFDMFPQTSHTEVVCLLKRK